MPLKQPPRDHLLVWDHPAQIRSMRIATTAALQALPGSSFGRARRQDWPGRELGAPLSTASPSATCRRASFPHTGGALNLLSPSGLRRANRTISR
jgi:hypothetical protein